MTAIISKVTDLVAVLNEDLEQVFEGAFITTANITEESQVMLHPVETGSTIVDEIVLQPITIVLNVTLNPNNYRSIYQEIKQAYLSRSLLTVQTKSDSYTSMVIEKIPHNEEPDVFDTITLTISLKEVTFVETQYEAFKLTAVKKASAVSTKNRGQIYCTANDKVTPNATQNITVVNVINVITIGWGAPKSQCRIIGRER